MSVPWVLWSPFVHLGAASLGGDPPGGGAGDDDDDDDAPHTETLPQESAKIDSPRIGALVHLGISVPRPVTSVIGKPELEPEAVGMLWSTGRAGSFLLVC